MTALRTFAADRVQSSGKPAGTVLLISRFACPHVLLQFRICKRLVRVQIKLRLSSSRSKQTLTCVLQVLSCFLLGCLTTDRRQS